jgi:hypothetical protein
MSQFTSRTWRFLGPVFALGALVLTLAACQPTLLQDVPEGAVSTPNAGEAANPGEETAEPAEEATERSNMESRTNGEAAGEAGLTDVEQELVDRAMADLAQELGLSEEEISLASMEAVEWPDASLGCPEEGMMYAQVITPGYRIMLEAGGETYEYHTGDREGSPVVHCESES